MVDGTPAAAPAAAPAAVPAKPGAAAPEVPAKPAAAPAQAPGGAPAPAAKPEGTPGAAPAVEKNADGTDKKPPAGGEVEGVKPNLEDPNKVIIKVKGKDFALTKEELVSYAQKGMGADEKFREAHKIRMGAEELFWLIKNKPLEVLTNPKLGLDFDKLAEEHLAGKLKLEMMTPEQREAHDNKMKLKGLEEENKTAKEKEEKTKLEAAVKHYTEEYEKDIMQTLESSILPKSRHIVKRFAYYLQEGIKRGVSLKCADVVDLVTKDYTTELNDFFSKSDGARIETFLGETGVKALNEHLVQKLRGAPPKPVVEEPAGASGAEDEKRLTPEEWREKVRKRAELASSK